MIKNPQPNFQARLEEFVQRLVMGEPKRISKSRDSNLLNYYTNESPEEISQRDPCSLDGEEQFIIRPRNK
jgi:hypothetical protein